MDTRIIAGGVGIVGLSVLGYALFFWSDDEDLIRERVEQLAAAVEVSDGQAANPAIAAVHLKSEFSEIFTPTVAVTIAEMEQAGAGGDAMPRAELAMFAGQLSARFEAATVSLGGVSVQILGEGARVDATATLTAKEHGGGLRRDTRDVDFELQKVDGEWLISGFVAGPPQSGSPF
jgi:hypothetical protein